MNHLAEASKAHPIAILFSESLILASLQFALSSTEMSSRYSVLNFSKDQDTLQNACNALSSYILIGIIFGIGGVLALYGSFGVKGAIVCAICNIAVMLWIVLSYLAAFKKAAIKYDLVEPKLFQSFW